MIFARRDTAAIWITLVVLTTAPIPAQPLGELSPARLEQRSFTSSTLGTRSFYLYLPPGYDSTAERYPVVILLRGVETEWIDPGQDAARRGSIMTVADSLWRSGALLPVILVMPRIGSPPTWTDMTYISDELLPWIDGRYRTLPTRTRRAVDGFSYGGLGSAMLITQAPERFISAGGYDGSLFLYSPASLELWRPERRALYATMQFLYTTTGPGQTGNQATNRAFVDTLAKYGIANGYDVLNLAPEAQHNWYFADLHVARTLPRHANWMAGAPQGLQATVNMPAADTTVKGNVSISWNIPSPPSPLRVFLQWSRDDGRRWHHLAESSSSDSSVVWNTLVVPDGTRYELRLIATGDTSFRELRTAGAFRVDNPGNGAPEIILLTELGERVSGNVTLRWHAADPEGSPITVSVWVSSDDGTTWTTLATGRAAVDSIEWAAGDAGNGSRYRLRLAADDGAATGEALSRRFAVANERQRLPYAVERIVGKGDVEVRAFAQHADPMLTSPFRLTIHRTLSGVRYNIRSVPEDSLLVPPTPVGRPDEEGPLFHGKRLSITIVDTPEVSPEETRWVVGNSNIAGTVALPTLTVDDVTYHGIPTPEDHEITVTADLSDTSMAAFGLTEQPVRFTVRTIGTEAHPSFIFLDADMSGGLSHGDELYFVPSGSMSPLQLGWWVLFSSPAHVILPSVGDRFQISIRRPPEDGDTFNAFTTYLSVQELASTPQGVVLEPAFPNPFNATTQIRYRLAETARITLSVADLLGRRVATLADGLQAAGEHTTEWTADGLATGVYFLQLEAGNVRTARKILYMK